jgi:hypothetical protein
VISIMSLACLPRVSIMVGKKDRNNAPSTLAAPARLATGLHLTAPGRRRLDLIWKPDMRMRLMHLFLTPKTLSS